MMNVVSWNVGGLGDVVKRRKVKEVVCKVSSDMLMIQETKLKEWEGFLGSSIWEFWFRDWVFLPKYGILDGIIIIWDVRFAKRIGRWKGSFCVSILLDIRGNGG